MSTVLSSQLWRPTVVTPFFDGNFRIDNFDSVRGLRSDRLKLRQVPGDGSCLFYAIAGSLDYIRTSTHSSFDDKLCNDADMLRKVSNLCFNSKIVFTSSLSILYQGIQRKY